MKILITGASGLIGRELGKRLATKGHEIVVAARDVNRSRHELPFPATAFAWQSGDESFPDAALKGVEAVINLAGEPIVGRWTEAKRKKIRDSRIRGTHLLAQAILKMATKPKAFIQGSAIGYYGDRGDEVLDESSSLGSGFLADISRDWELETDSLTTAGIRVAKIRTGVVLSRRGGALATMLPVFSKGLGGKLGNGQQWMSWIHIEDIVGAFIYALENDSMEGVYNGTAPEPARNERFTVALARAIGRDVFLPVPEAALKLAMGEASSMVLASERVLPKRLLEAGYVFQYPELTPALDELGSTLIDGQQELVAEQWLPHTPEEIFPYFSSEKNLEEITPPFLGFKVIGMSTAAIGKGTLIDYRLSLHGFPLKWRTRIDEWSPSQRFVDTQLSGPYAKWHHTHEFVKMGNGTLVKDRVLYKLPLGVLGDTVAGWKVARDVREIFAYRRMKIDQRFGAEKWVSH